MKKILLLCTVLMLLCSCGKKTKGFSEEELQEIHAKEESLRQQLVGKTWHYSSEPARAVRYLEDGSYEDYLGPGIRNRDYFSGDDGTWQIKYCESLSGDTSFLEEDKERAQKYYDYNVLVTYINREGKTKTYTQSIAFSSGDLILSGDKLYDGPAVIEHMPDDLKTFDLLPGHVWYLDGFDSYALFFDDGYCYMTYGIFIDGQSNGSYLYRWGFDEDNVFLYLMDYYKDDDKVYEDVRQYAIDGAIEDGGNIYLQLAETWSNGENIMGMRIVDDQDYSAKALMHSYNQLHKWTLDNWDSLSH